ncbi:hypothetical protein COU19_01905 [Candidatus Kaiserbacteria bacterium CG10_big_fil_rev_8_21_14_0_10_56_12]|uniref:Uncharacterized protein n=1 Tax=Candidatus Kaiserbacteria bacterium CG10_big_fil_rev_8_21_14_0_10_56_12 TaxID=1974611 RepID=A0A2H0UBM5_9BACT|nr:MAG: hypothetical protein COU19_01905 [Candidatus Kaiserbacteria bacterium CG10_big_fil_rev_8_21_14_0_10_56_12]
MKEFFSEHTVKKISPSGEEYNALLQERAERSQDKIFGGDLLRARPTEGVEGWKSLEGLAAIVFECQKRQTIEILRAYAMMQDAESHRVVLSYLRMGLEFSPIVREELAKIAGSHAGHGAEGTPEEALARFIASGHEIPAQLLIGLVEGNKVGVSESAKPFLEHELPALKREFTSTLPDLFKKYDIHENALEDPLAKIATVGVRAVDEFSGHLEELGGGYHAWQHRVIVSMDVLNAGSEEKRHVLDHELLHAASGKHAYQLSDGGTYAYGARTGLHFYPTAWRDKGTYTPRFAWLNEAVTERLTEEIMMMQSIRGANFVYEAEQKILEHLCTKGKTPIQFKKFVQAYFENYEPAQKEGERTVPAWRELWAAIEESFGKQYLVKLDTMIKEVGAARVLESLENGG